MKNFPFTKMQGLGNDFVLIDGPFQLSAEEIREICDRRLGIGADGVLIVTRGDPIRMEYWNADGSPAEMCGNGLRCVARYAYEKGWAMDRNFAVQTPAGTRGVRVLDDRIEVQIGPAHLLGELSVDEKSYQLVDVGNPHAVTSVDDLDGIDVETIGRSLQHQFETGVNVEFVNVTVDRVKMRVWERGVGETQACGTGMVAAALVGTSNEGLASPVTVEVPGGTGHVDFRGGSAWLSGPADYSFRGNVGER